MNLTAIKDAIYVMTVIGSGLPASSVIWSRQKVPRPVTPFIELRLSGRKMVGFDWLSTENAVPVIAGAELNHFSRGPRVFVVTFRCFATSGSTDASEPEAILERLRSRARLPSIADPLADAGIGLSQFEDIQSLDGVINSTILEPRASMTVPIFLIQEETETGTFVESAEIEGTI